MKRHLLTLITTLLLVTTMATLPVYSVQVVNGYKIPNNAFMLQCITSDTPQALIDEFIRINHLGSEFFVDVAWSSNKQETESLYQNSISLEKNAVAVVYPPSATVAVICIAIVVGGIVIYVLYKVVKLLDKTLTNSQMRTNLNEDIITDK